MFKWIFIFLLWSDTLIISPAFAILLQLISSSRVHLYAATSTISENPLFSIDSQKLSAKGVVMSTDTYSQGVKRLFSLLGISKAATEHSARRGGAGFSIISFA